MTRKYTELQELHSKANSTIQALKNKAQKLEKNAENFEKRIKLLDKFQALLRNSNWGSTWSPQTIKRELQMKLSCGTSGYGTLRKLRYPLPSNRTVTRRLQGLKFFPVILTDVIDLLRMKAESMEDIEKESLLFLDEMEISQGYELDRAGDVLGAKGC